MDHNLEQLKKEFNQAALRDSERNALKARLVTFMHDMPANSRRFSFTHIFYNPALRLAPIALVVLFFIGGGISQLAENSLPGEILYPIKTNVNEELRGFIDTSSPEAVAELETDLASRRLAELEQVQVKPDVEPQTISSLEIQVDSHVERAEQNIVSAESRSSKSAEVSISNNRLAKIKEKLQGLKDRRGSSLNKNASVQMFMAAPAADSSLESQSAPVEDASKTNQRSFKNAGNANAVIEAPKASVPMMMQMNSVMDASSTPLVFDCFASSTPATTSALYRLERTKALSEKLEEHTKGFFLSKTERRFKDVEERVQKLLNRHDQDDEEEVDEDLQSLEKELFGKACPNRDL